MKRVTLILICALVSYAPLFSTGDVSIKVMQRVNTADPMTKAVLAAWADSLAVWSSERSINAGSSDIDLARTISTKHVVQDWFSQSDEVALAYPPTVLSIERSNNGWVIRTTFATSDTTTGHVIPLGTIRSWFTLDIHGRLEIEDPLHHTSDNLTSTHVGSITYRHPVGMEIDLQRGERASGFVSDLAKNFGIEVPPSTTMYVLNSPDEMIALLGVEYYAFPPAGLTYTTDNIVLNGRGDPYYPHELVHAVLSEFDEGAHPIVREGVATWLGGSGTQSFKELATDYLASTSPNDVPSFVQLFTEAPARQDDQYVLGAVVCNAIYSRGGMDALKSVLQARTTSETMLRVGRYLGIDPADIQPSLMPFIKEAVQIAQAKPGR